ncbi:amidohydrolase family protein [Rhizobium sp. NXC24]|uniref:amidohydrolase family protein n=1 Tax=Rhizobium sp. NXC24 TaxID=2048897 RepID=UPI001FE0B6D2|nr:amidohydrolase family protein [Rhizobium sp. NXC24]
MTENLSIDGHVHFFTASDLAAVEGQLPYSLPSPHSLSDYLADLACAGIFPKLLNNVHLSILPDSSNVFASFDELAALKAKWPERYGDVRLVGTIKADPAYATIERLSHPDVFGIRIVLHDAPPESISDRAYRSDDWVALIGRLRVQQHVHIYAKEAETNLRVLRQMPETICVVIDHLGSCHAERGADEPSYRALLEEAKRRGNVWFKGPGYRTSTDIDDVVPFVSAIIATVGANRVLLSASDAPHVGAGSQGHSFTSHFDSVSALKFSETLASAVSAATDIPVLRLLNAAANDLFPCPEESETMTDIIVEDITFPVAYDDATINLAGTVFQPASPDRSLPPVVFNSGFTGGVSMYGQLFGRALAERGYRVMTYDVAGFFTNRDVRNTAQKDGITVTNVSLVDQTAEVLAAVRWAREKFGSMPVVASWAMGSVVSLAAVVELAKQGKEQIAFWVPMNYTSIAALQNLRADKSGADAAIKRLADDAAIPPFDTGTEATKLGYYPLDTDTQEYVDRQLGGYTEIGGVYRWPGCSHVTAKSYKKYVGFDPEKSLNGASGFPPALIVHGAQNTLHMPEESIRLHKLYPGRAGDEPLIIEGMMHGQQNQTDNPIFHQLIKDIDRAIRSA